MGKKKVPLFCYAVAIGRGPGLYKSWDECRRQVDGFQGNAYRGCETREQAEKFMEDRGAGAFAAFLDSQSADPGGPDMASRVKPEPSGSQSALAPKTSPSQTQQPRISSKKIISLQDIPPYRSSGQQQQPPASTQMTFKDEWAEIAASQQLPPGSQAWKEGRTKAMHEILEEIFFDGKSEVEGFQGMCRAVGVEPGSTREECKDAMLAVLVNIVDFIDDVRAGRPVEVWELEEWEEFRKYTDDDDKRFNLGIAKESGILSCFLQRLRDSGPKRPRTMPKRLSENVSAHAHLNRPTSDEVSDYVSDDMSDGISDSIPDSDLLDDTPSSATEPWSCASNSKKRGIVEEPGREAHEIKRPRIVID
ncbi:hypothetical protein DL766_003530 [Monosporascus sp. MC13-8B]|uniref:Ribonuclease H1 N-terminal domain-containing protein n=1 Tax=Monosporascus cannonballus TaxID=155416 RepID=A0ABY0H754_9PEZI|nr:hypothetical protein DL762_004649 [Monosporascus cannonballus]RYO95877.1 hypothetical protein DL763_003511 [Monosporascus cannonballus]RYP33301.1 hypothetical protein DL766_003530 [Monosporascus sp. MC13-8B]